jgi:hypothetical protein
MPLRPGAIIEHVRELRRGERNSEPITSGRVAVVELVERIKQKRAAT